MRAHGVRRRALAHAVGPYREAREHVAMLVESRLELGLTFANASDDGLLHAEGPTIVGRKRAARGKFEMGSRRGSRRPGAQLAPSHERRGIFAACSPPPLVDRSDRQWTFSDGRFEKRRHSDGNPTANCPTRDGEDSTSPEGNGADAPAPILVNMASRIHPGARGSRLALIESPGRACEWSPWRAMHACRPLELSGFRPGLLPPVTCRLSH
jgi:hypothetical protein